MTNTFEKAFKNGLDSILMMVWATQLINHKLIHGIKIAITMKAIFFLQE
jgi:aryl carrier-like protein